MLAEKTIALQNKVIYWTELSKDINAPEVIYSTNNKMYQNFLFTYFRAANAKI